MVGGCTLRLNNHDRSGSLFWAPSGGGISLPESHRHSETSLLIPSFWGLIRHKAGAGVLPPHRPVPGLANAGSGVVVWTPSTPLLGVILGPSKPSKSAPKRAEFFRFFRPLRCIAQGGWGGSAHYPDPTAQSAQSSGPASAPRTCRDSRRDRVRSGPAWPPARRKTRKKFSFFLRKVVFVSGWTNGGVAIGCADVAVGGGRGRRLPHCLRSATLGVGP